MTRRRERLSEPTPVSQHLNALIEDVLDATKAEEAWFAAHSRRDVGSSPDAELSELEELRALVVARYAAIARLREGAREHATQAEAELAWRAAGLSQHTFSVRIRRES